MPYQWRQIQFNVGKGQEQAIDMPLPRENFQEFNPSVHFEEIWNEIKSAPTHPELTRRSIHTTE